MTLVTAQTSTIGRVPVVEGVAAVHAVLDHLDPDCLGEVRGRDVAEVDRAISRLVAVKMSMVAAAHRQRAGQRAGMTGTAAWLAAHTRSWGARAASDVALATALEESLPVTRRALASGDLSPDHAAVIAGTAQRLPESLSEAERLAVEGSLVAQARHVDPARLRRSARRALAAVERSAKEVRDHEDAELRDEESRARRRVRLTLHDNLDGTVSGHFTVPTVAGMILRNAIQQMVSPRRRRGGPGDGALAAGPPKRHRAGGASDDLGGGASGNLGGRAHDVVGAAGHSTRGTGHGPGVGPSAVDAPRDWAHENGCAFVELLEHLPTDHLSGKVAATVVVTIDHERLLDAVGAAHLDTGHDLSAGETRRLACSAGILPAVLGGGSLPLDLGRSRRLFSESQRVALATSYDECAASGCDRPYAWAELHHEQPWGRGGATDLALAVPLCGSHHQRVHDPRFEHEVTTDGRGHKVVFFHRRT